MSSRIAWSGWVCLATLLLGCGGADSIDGPHAGPGGSTGGASSGGSESGGTASGGATSGGTSSGGTSSGGTSSGGTSSGGAPNGGTGGALTGGTGGGAGGKGGSSGGEAVCAPNAECNGLDYCEDLCFGNDCCYLSCDCRIDESTSCAAAFGHLCCTMVCK